jgi:hypothetical protein
MIVCRPYIQTRFFNFSIGFVIPVISSWILVKILPNFDLSHKIYYGLSLLILILPGFYFLIARCVWGLNCDEEKRTLTFLKTFRKKIFSVREIKELSVFKSLRSFDYNFKTAKDSVTFEEMDGLPELIAFLKKANPQMSINSPEDHKYF